MKLLLLLASCNLLLPQCMTLQCYNGTEMAGTKAVFSVVTCRPNEVSCFSYTIPFGYEKGCADSDFCTLMGKVAEEEQKPFTCHHCFGNLCNAAHKFENHFVPKGARQQCIEATLATSEKPGIAQFIHKSCKSQQTACCWLRTPTQNIRACCSPEQCLGFPEPTFLCDTCYEQFCNEDDPPKETGYESISDSNGALEARPLPSFGSLVLVLMISTLL